MSNQKSSKGERDALAAEYTESLRALVREELKQAIKEGAIDKEMHNNYGVHRRSR